MEDNEYPFLAKFISAPKTIADIIKISKTKSKRGNNQCFAKITRPLFLDF